MQINGGGFGCSNSALAICILISGNQLWKLNGIGNHLWKMNGTSLINKAGLYNTDAHIWNTETTEKKSLSFNLTQDGYIIIPRSLRGEGIYGSDDYFSSYEWDKKQFLDKGAADSDGYFTITNRKNKKILAAYWGPNNDYRGTEVRMIFRLKGMYKSKIVSIQRFEFGE